MDTNTKQTVIMVIYIVIIVTSFSSVSHSVADQGTSFFYYSKLYRLELDRLQAHMP